jgi:hypothetical protein
LNKSFDSLSDHHTPELVRVDSIPNETMSQSLLQKLEDISCTDDRVLSQIVIVKDPVFSDRLNYKSLSLRNLANVDSFIAGYTMGISIIQGTSDNYVYV